MGSLQTPPRRVSPFNLLAPSLGLRVAAGMSVHSQVQFQGASLIYPPVLSLTRGGNSIASAEVGPIYRSWPQRDGCVCLVGLEEILHDKTIDKGEINKKIPWLQFFTKSLTQCACIPDSYTVSSKTLDLLLESP